MKVKKTSRGFQVVEFEDYYGVPCSLQQSSAAILRQPGAGAVWFGPNDAHPRCIVPGKSWQPVPFPQDTLFDTRAHLDRKQVTKLVAYLQCWLKCGYFVPPRPKAKVVGKPHAQQRHAARG